LKQSFTTHMTLLMASRTFGLQRRSSSFSEWYYVHKKIKNENW